LAALTCGLALLLGLPLRVSAATPTQEARKCYEKMRPGIVDWARRDRLSLDEGDISLGVPMPTHHLQDDEFRRLSAQDPAGLKALLKGASRFQTWAFIAGKPYAVLDLKSGSPGSCLAKKLGDDKDIASWGRQFARTPWLLKQPMGLVDYDGIVMALFDHDATTYLALVSAPRAGPAPAPAPSREGLNDFKSGFRVLESWSARKRALSAPSNCKKLGEAPVPNGPGYNTIPQCCAGLVERTVAAACGQPIGGYAGICLACGDGGCDEKFENKCNCPEDCK